MMASSVSSEPLFLFPSVTFAVTAAALVATLRAEKKRPEKPAVVNEKMNKESILALRHKFFSKAVSISYSNSNPVLFVRGSGSRLYDENDVSYLDTRNNVPHCGHCHPAVVAAVQQQVAVLNTNTRYLHPNVTALAQRLTALLPEPLDTVFFVNSGSEANDLALRLARAHANGSRNTVVVQGSYHGHTGAVLQVSPFKYNKGREFPLTKPADTAEFATPGPHIWQVPAPDLYRGKYRDMATAGSDYSKSVEEACDFYVSKGEKVSAFIMEGGMSIPGVILPPPGYLKRCAAAVRKAGGLFIADEVQSGMGRMGSSFWAFQYQHPGYEEAETVIPDIVTMGKPLGNGMPLAACITTRKVAEAFEALGTEYFNTFGGNPVCAAAGLAVLDTMEKEQLQKHALETGAYLKDRFLSLELDLVGDVRGSGLFLGLELVRNRETQEPATQETSFVSTMLKEKYKVLTSIDGIHENVLIIKPPMCFSKADCDYFVESFQSAVLVDMVAAGDVRSWAKTPT